MQELAFKDDEVKSLIQKSDFIEVKPLSKKIGQDLLDSNLDKGETEAIALALETNLSLIIDERSGRKFAEKKGVKIIGLLGILKANLARDHIAYTELLYILEEFKSVDFRLSKRLEEDFLKSLKLHQ
jgi:predicted nucleic acid-binding protein